MKLNLSTINLSSTSEGSEKISNQLFTAGLEFDLVTHLPLDLVSVFPELFLFVAISTLLLVGSAYSTSEGHGSPIMVQPITWLAFFSLILTLCLHLNGSSTGVFFSGAFLLDDVTYFIKSVVFVSSAACLLVSMSYLEKEHVHAFEFSILILLTVVGGMILISAHDLVTFYLSIEMISLSSYVLATFQRKSAYSTEAGLKYFLLGAFASGLLLFGIALIYGLTGTTNMSQLALFASGLSSLSIETSSGLVTGMVFIVVSLLFKVTAAPFHMWAPDVYEGSPMPVATYFAVVPKIAILAFLLRFCYSSLYSLADSWVNLIILASVSSMIVSALAALQQKRLKRFFAYSSIGHVGYLLIGCATGNVDGISSLLVYTVIYVIMTLNAWTLISTIQTIDGKRGIWISDLNYMSRINPVIAITLTMTLLSMAGVPPLAGFVAKMKVFLAAMSSGLYWLALIGVLTSVVGAFYYIRFIKVMYFEKMKGWVAFSPMDQGQSIILGSTTSFILFFFIGPSILITSGDYLGTTFTL